MKRSPGYYWVRFQGRWEIARWTDTTKEFDPPDELPSTPLDRENDAKLERNDGMAFLLIGWDPPLVEEDLEAINEVRLDLRPPE